MRRYEVIVIANADLNDDDLNDLVARYSAIVTGNNGILANVERWGKKRLAYLIKKQSRGYYILIDFAGQSSIVKELERNLKIDDKILKFMTVMKDGHVDAVALQEEIAEAAKKIESKEETNPVPAPSAQTADEEAIPEPQATESQEPVSQEEKTEV